MFLGQFRPVYKGEVEEPKSTQKPPEQEKSSTSEEFVKTPEARDFVGKWMAVQRDDKPVYTRRGVVALLKALYPSFDSNKKVLTNADDLLKMLGGMDGLQGFLMGWKAKSEGLIKGMKTLLGGK